jgi:hypothetical protein
MNNQKCKVCDKYRLNCECEKFEAEHSNDCEGCEICLAPREADSPNVAEHEHTGSTEHHGGDGALRTPSDTDSPDGVSPDARVTDVVSSNLTQDTYTFSRPKDASLDERQKLRPHSRNQRDDVKSRNAVGGSETEAVGNKQTSTFKSLKKRYCFMLCFPKCNSCNSIDEAQKLVEDALTRQFIAWERDLEQGIEENEDLEEGNNRVLELLPIIYMHLKKELFG